MRVLVTAASRHGATDEIARQIGDEMEKALDFPAVEVHVRPADAVDDVLTYDAAVIGSAIYMGRWQEPARRLVEAVAASHREMPVWLFSSGPIGDPPQPLGDSADAVALAELPCVREHATFAGRLDKHDLRLTERAVVKTVRAPEGDFRDWTAIRQWARHVASEINSNKVR
jgi:menaquinone-dependent protoporphyrinogen oxidase